MSKLRTFDAKKSSKPSKETLVRWAKEDIVRRMRTAAWHEGMAAWSGGVKRTGNPYAQTSSCYSAWDDGWAWALRVEVQSLKRLRRLGDYTAWPKQLKDVKP